MIALLAIIILAIGFTLWVHPDAAAHLDSGPLGFYDERGQRPEVQSLRFTFVKKGAARTAAATLP